MLWCDLDLTFELALVTLTFKIFISLFMIFKLFHFFISHDIESYFSGLWGTGISKVIFKFISRDKI